MGKRQPLSMSLCLHHSVGILVSLPWLHDEPFQLDVPLFSQVKEIKYYM